MLAPIASILTNGSCSRHHTRRLTPRVLVLQLPEVHTRSFNYLQTSQVGCTACATLFSSFECFRCTCSYHSPPYRLHNNSSGTQSCQQGRQPLQRQDRFQHHLYSSAVGSDNLASCATRFADFGSKLANLHALHCLETKGMSPNGTRHSSATVCTLSPMQQGVGQSGLTVPRMLNRKPAPTATSRSSNAMKTNIHQRHESRKDWSHCCLSYRFAAAVTRLVVQYNTWSYGCYRSVT